MLKGLDATLIRQRPMSALIVGATGFNVLRVVSAFEGRRIATVRVDDVNGANERIAHEMPHVVLVLIPTTPEEQEAIADRALAVGALVVHANPADPTLPDILDRAIVSALEKKLHRDQADLARGPTIDIDIDTDTAPPPPNGGIDEGWDE